MNRSRHMLAIKALSLFALLSLTWGCEKPIQDTPPPSTFHNSVFITCEGGMSNGNASLSVYDTVARKIYNNAILNVNGVSPGDIIQSMSIIDGRAYIVVDNSGKIMVVDPKTCKHIATIKGLVSPRYVESISPDKIYVSALFNTNITIVNPQTLEITGYIKVGASTEQMVKLADKVYVCSWSYNNQVYKIDTRTNQVVDSVTVAKQPCSMVLDSKNMIWTLSDGGYDGMPGGKELAALTQIDPSTMTVVQEMKFPSMNIAPRRLTIDGTGSTLYFIDNRYGAQSATGGVFRMSIQDKQLPSEPFIVQGTRLFYGLGIDPRSGEFYLSDAVDWASSGYMMRYSAYGELIDIQKVGINPGGFCF